MSLNSGQLRLGEPMNMMSERITPQSRPDGLTALWRGTMGRCPNCGKGALLHRYLKVVPNCSVCGEAFSHLPADDMPPWLTILIVGHVLFGSVWYVERHFDIAVWMEMTLWPVLGLALTLILLPRCKGFVLALLWVLRRAPAENQAEA
jgi:uncharacterized protein (DUF983 family)